MRKYKGKPGQEGFSEEMTFEWSSEAEAGEVSRSFRKIGALGGLSKETWI